MKENEVRGILVPVLAACIRPALSITSRARNVVCISRITVRAPRDIPGDRPVDFHGAISMQIALSPFATDTTPRCDLRAPGGKKGRDWQSRASLIRLSDRSTCEVTARQYCKLCILIVTLDGVASTWPIETAHSSRRRL